jgi:nitroreductase
METLQAIHNRHSFGVIKAEAVPHEIIIKLLSAGAQAPNHYKIRPWRFFVLTGKGLENLGEVMAASFKSKFPDAPAEAADKERAKPLRAPLIIAVGVDKPSEPKVLEIENICAAAAACQNILLAAHDLGLTAIWRTGDNARDPEVKKFLGLEPDQLLVGFLYIGLPDNVPAFPVRPGFEDRTVWVD